METDEYQAYLKWKVSARQEIDGWRHEVKDLKAENAKLREDNACLVKAIEELHSVKLEDRLVALENENDRLRELVSGLEHCVGGFECNRCPLYDPSGTNHRRCESLERELGIEVGE